MSSPPRDSGRTWSTSTPDAGKSPKHQSHQAEPLSCTRRRSLAAASRRVARRLPRARRERTLGRPSYAPWCVLQRPRCVAGSVQSIQRMCVPLVVVVVVVCPPPDSNRGTLRNAYGSPRGGRYHAPLAVGSAGLHVLADTGPVRTRWGPHALTTPFGAPGQGAVTHGRCGPRALPHDPCGHPSNGGAWCTGNACSESRALSPPTAPVLGGCAVIPLSGFSGERRFPAPFRTVGPFSLSVYVESGGFPEPQGALRGRLRFPFHSERESEGFPERRAVALCRTVVRSLFSYIFSTCSKKVV